MAMDAANSSPARNPVRKESSMSMLKEIAPSSADMLAKRLDNSSGGPISKLKTPRFIGSTTGQLLITAVYMYMSISFSAKTVEADSVASNCGQMTRLTRDGFANPKT